MLSAWLAQDNAGIVTCSSPRNTITNCPAKRGGRGVCLGREPCDLGKGIFEITIKGNATADWREAYISNEFIVLDRWGKKVYQQTNYRSGEWDGANLSDGTYFYILKCQGQFGDDVFKGAITILRGQGQN